MEDLIKPTVYYDFVSTGDNVFFLSLYRGDFFAILKGSAALIKAKGSSLKDTDLNFVSALPYGDASFTSIAALEDKIAVISSDGVVFYSSNGGQNFKRSHQTFPFVKVIRFIPDGTIVFGNEPPEAPIVIRSIEEIFSSYELETAAK